MINTKRLWLATHFIRLLPETSAWRLKRSLWRWSGIDVADDVRICSSVTVLGAGTLKIGSGTWIGHQVLLICAGEIEIGANCDLAPRVLLETGTHQLSPDGDHVAGSGVVGKIELENGCWICAGAMVLPDVHVGTHAVIAAGAVVTNSIPAYSIWGGVPAKQIRLLK